MTSATKSSYLRVFWTLAILGLVLDIGSKYVVFTALYPTSEKNISEKVTIIPGAFDLTAGYKFEVDPGSHLLSPLRTISGPRLPYVNQGALFGMGQGNNYLFTAISLAAAFGIVWWVTRKETGKDFVLNGALGLILAGTLGNLYDRVVFEGVRDFLHWYYLVDWPVFNIADCCLVCGASLLLVHAVFFHGKAEEPVETESEQQNKEMDVVELH